MMVSLRTVKYVLAPQRKKDGEEKKKGRKNVTSEKKICDHCGAKIVEYKHGLGKGLMRGLYKIARAGGGPINIRTIGLTVDELTNFQKLRYWNLVAKSDPKSEKGGDWNLTGIGVKFVQGELRIPKYVWTFRGKFSRYDGAQVGFEDVTGGYKYRIDYARDAVPHKRE